MPLAEKKQFKAKLDFLYEMLLWVRERVDKYLKQNDLNRMELVLEEVLVNIMNHAYKMHEGSIHLSIMINELIEITIIDEGPAFNPLIKRRIKQEIGGVGNKIIRQYVDGIAYQRKGKKNILTIKKKKSQDY